MAENAARRVGASATSHLPSSLLTLTRFHSVCACSVLRNRLLFLTSSRSWAIATGIYHSRGRPLIPIQPDTVCASPTRPPLSWPDPNRPLQMSRTPPAREPVRDRRLICAHVMEYQCHDLLLATTSRRSIPRPQAHLHAAQLNHPILPPTFTRMSRSNRHRGIRSGLGSRPIKLP